MTGYISRKEQLELLNKGLEVPLTLLVAAAGSGKSCLLNEWIKDTDDCHIIHVELTTRLSDRDTFLNHLFNELKQIVPFWDATFHHLFEKGKALNRTQIVECLQEVFEEIPECLILIFDDFHKVDSEEIHLLIGELISQIPSHIHIVISSRRYPLFSVSRLKLEGRVFVVDGNDLRLTEFDVEALSGALACVALEGLSLPSLRLTNEAIQQVLSLSEGWFVGVKLALLAYGHTGQGALNTFSGSQPDLVNYFGYEVLRNLSEDTRTFVLTTSLFDEFDLGLYQHITGVQQCSTVLQTVVSQELFIIPIPGKSGSYRYHPLLQEFLQRQLALDCDDQFIKTLHARAAEYFYHNNAYELATKHANLSGDRAYYFKLLSKVCDSWLRDGQFENIITTLAALNDSGIQTSKPLMIILVFALIFTRRFNQASYYIEILKTEDKKLGKKTKCLNQTSSGVTRGESFIDFGIYSDRILTLFQREDEAFSKPMIDHDLMGHNNMDIRGLSMLIAGYELMYQGHYDEAFKLAHQARSLLLQVGHRFLATYADLEIVLCDRNLGRADEAMRHLSEAFSEMEHEQESHGWINLASGMMVVHYERNELDAVSYFGQKLLPALNYTCATEVINNVYLYYSRLLSLKGDRKKSERLLHQLKRILSLGNYNRFQGQVTQEFILQALQNKQSQKLQTLVEEYSLARFINERVFESANSYDEGRERCAFAASYWLAHEGRYIESERILTQIVDHATVLGIRYRSLIAEANLCVLKWKRGDKKQAVMELRHLIDGYGILGFSRTVYDEAPGLKDVFQFGLNSELLSGSERIHVPDAYLNLFDGLLSFKHQCTELLSIENLLTPKEVEIFTLLSLGLSNADISRKANIALSTTKWHLKNIYVKLGVDSRSAAISLSNALVSSSCSS